MTTLRISKGICSSVRECRQPNSRPMPGTFSRSKRSESEAGNELEAELDNPLISLDTADLDLRFELTPIRKYDMGQHNPVASHVEL